MGGGERKVDDNDETELEGYVSGFVSPASFKLNGIRVDASNPTVKFANGTVASIVNGVPAAVPAAVAA